MKMAAGRQRKNWKKIPKQEEGTWTYIGTARVCLYTCQEAVSRSWGEVLVSERFRLPASIKQVSRTRTKLPKQTMAKKQTKNELRI